MVRNFIRFIIGIFTFSIFLNVMLVLYLLCSREYIPVDYVASYNVNIDVDANEFDAFRTVRDVRNELETNTFFENYGNMDGLYDLLSEYDENTRVVISFGSRIKYFWLPKGEYHGFINVEYKSDKSEDKIYIHTIDYDGPMIDIASY